MRITQKQIKRLEYVENELELLANPHLTKVVHNVKEEITSQPEYVYVLDEEGSWDFEYTTNCECFSGFKPALNRFKELRDQAIKDMNEWLDEDEIETNESINEEREQASFEIYEAGNYPRLHNNINIHKEEVK